MLACDIPQAPIRLQGSSADAAAGALGDWTLEGAPDLIQTVNVGNSLTFEKTKQWLEFKSYYSRTYIKDHQGCND